MTTIKLAVVTTAEKAWNKLVTKPGEGAADLTVGAAQQPWWGFGGCFNELGWIALQKLAPPERDAVFKDLFDPKGPLRLTWGRIPIGANDYAAEWYSHDEHAGDTELKKFSVARDEAILLPYIRAALKLKPDLKTLASPWSPPTWMKSPRAYNNGRLIDDAGIHRAYALYLARFIEEYRRHGVAIHQLHPQNEPVAEQKFPSCVWTGPQLRDFIRDHLAPTLSRRKLNTEVWLGTLNTDDYAGFTGTVLADAGARAVVKGVGYQWAGKHAVARTHAAFPDLPLMQTENECGDGNNTWDYALYVADLIRLYLHGGTNAYVYWNMVLLPKGESTWGWKQNAMFTVDPVGKKAVRNPEFHVMRHASQAGAAGGNVLAVSGEWSAYATAFANPDGTTGVFMANPLTVAKELTIATPAGALTCSLAPRSVATLVVA